MTDLSILIPARNEIFLGRTIEDILANIEGNTEIIAVLDGYKPEPPLSPDPRVTLIYHSESIGQRAATNEAARLSKAKYVMKCDAHCSFDKGFDIKMMAEMHDDWTMAPLMRNLHAFDWVCPDGHRRYQGPSGPCSQCGKETTKDVLWRAKDSPKSVSYCFDSTPHFQYFGEYSKRPEGKGDITETMSLQGSCFMLTRDKYWELGVCDENFGSWGSQGIEVAVKTWLSGGRVMVNKKTWYAHMFRTQGGDFSFPYPISGRDQEKAKNFARDLFFNNKWPLQKRPLSWLIEKFWPVKGWSDEDLKKLKANTFKFSASQGTKPAESEPTEELSDKGIIYSSSDACKEKPCKGIIFYSDCQLDEEIAKPVREQILKISQEKDIPIVSATLKKMDFGVKNIHFPHLKRGPLTLFKQIYAALKYSSADIIFFCEHDDLYDPSHFDFTPPADNRIEPVYYYNINVWQLRLSDGHCVYYHCRKLSQMCCYREIALEHFRKKIERVESDPKCQNGHFDRHIGFEPGTRNIRGGGVDDSWRVDWKSLVPNIDLRHDKNYTGSKWKVEQFMNSKNQNTVIKTWLEGDEIPGWGKGKDIVKAFQGPTKGIVYYSDCQLDEKIAGPVRDKIFKISQEKNIPVVSATLKKMDFGVKNIHFPSLKPGFTSMFKQIVAALEHSTADIIFFCEHDILYHPSHFDFIPPDKNTFYYNQNVWFLRTSDGHALHYDVNQLSGLCGYREQLLTHFRERYEMILKEGFSREMGFEPMTHNRIKWNNIYRYDTWKSKYPNIDIRHPDNATGQRWEKSQFRNKKLLINWQESDEEIPGWGKTIELIEKVK